MPSCAFYVTGHFLYRAECLGFCVKSIVYGVKSIV